MKLLLFFIAFTGILREVSATKNYENLQDLLAQCRNYVEQMNKCSTGPAYSEDKLTANFNALSKVANEIKSLFLRLNGYNYNNLYMNNPNEFFFNSIDNAKKFFKDIGNDANKSHIQKWIKQVRTDSNVFFIENDLLEIWNETEYNNYILQEDACNKLTKIRSTVISDDDKAFDVVSKAIQNAEKKCKSIQKDKRDYLKGIEFNPIFVDMLLTVKKAFYERDLNGKIKMINEMGINIEEIIGIGKIFQQNYKEFQKFVNSFSFIEYENIKTDILKVTAQKTFCKVKELNMVTELDKLKESVIKSKNEMNSVDEIIGFRIQIRKEINSIIGIQMPAFKTDLGKTFYETEMENLINDTLKKDQFLQDFFWISEMEKHLVDIKQAFKVNGYISGK